MTEPNSIDAAVRALTGIPYRHGGRSREGLDCLGLVFSFYKLMGIAIPDNDGTPYPSDWYKKDPGRLLRGVENVGRPISLSDLRALDLVYFKIGGVISHIGVMIDSGRFIHVIKDRKVEVSSMNLFWRRHLVGARRLV